ncbi:MAG: hypothetical protein KDA87_11605 [Planctomycetales bacterium]|nr:hypothetical protein [Planctomycetales bacterium]
MPKSVLTLFAIGTATTFGVSMAVVADENSTDSTANVKIRWDAKADIAALSGEWQVQRLPFVSDEIRNAERSAIVKPFYDSTSVLRIYGHAFQIEGTAIAGAITNDMNDRQFVPKTILNTNEPRLKFTLADGTEAIVSYVVEEDQLAFRYPANSCSRSGMRFTLIRKQTESP